MTTNFDEHGFPIPPTRQEIKSVWDCVDPCAFVCYAVQINAIPFDDTVRETLDSFGWLNPDGYPDYEHMRREFARKTQ